MRKKYKVALQGKRLVVTLPSQLAMVKGYKPGDYVAWKLYNGNLLLVPYITARLGAWK